MFKVILCCISTSSGRRPLLLIQISIYSVDACTLAMVWVGYARVQLKTVSSLLKLVSHVKEVNRAKNGIQTQKGVHYMYLLLRLMSTL